MKTFSLIGQTLLAFTSIATAAWIPEQAPGKPIPPRKDPWYAAPSNWESARPGEVLQVRRAPGNLTTAFNASDSFNILYRTTDTNYKPSWAVSTLFVPKVTNSSALLSYQIPYNTPDVDASPSYAFYTSPTSQGLAYTDVVGALSRGWYVNVPDFEGPLASFGCFVQEGHATLDSIRATLNQFSGWSLKNNTKIALWGYSGGSYASTAAIELQVQYAPELKIAGAALGGTVPSFANLVPNIVGTYFAALIPAFLVGFGTQHPEVEQYYMSQLKQSGPYNASTFLSVQNMSIQDGFNFFANQSVYDYFENGEDFFNDTILQDAFVADAHEGYHGLPQMPVFIYKAIADEVTLVGDTDKLVDFWCQARRDILYERNTIGGHLTQETNGDASAFEWLNTVLSGTFVQNGCTIRNVSLNISDSAL